MKLFKLVVLAALALTGTACGSDPTGTPPSAGPDEHAEVAAPLSTPASTCRAKTDGSGPFQEFKTSLTRRIKRPKLADKVVTIDVTKTDRWLWGTTKDEKLVVQLNGKTLLQTSVNRYSFNSEFVVSQNYFPPYQGVSTAVANTINGTLFALVDGRSIVPVPVNTPASAIRYDDGLPGPNVTLDPDVLSAMNDLISSTKAAASKCIFDDTVGPSDGSNLMASPGTAPHPSDTRNNASCQLCRGGCAGVAGVCFYTAGTSLACGPFVFFCALGEIALCTLSELGCLKLCDGAGSACCAVACGGEGKPNFIAPPPPGASVGCCRSGEQCASRSTGLCCSPGTTACNGTTCCGSGQTCVTTGPQAGTCCDAGSVACGGVCCPSGQSCGSVDGFPMCCKGCSNDAQCGGPSNGSLNVCNRGCCLNIPG